MLNQFVNKTFFLLQKYCAIALWICPLMFKALINSKQELPALMFNICKQKHL